MIDNHTTLPSVNRKLILLIGGIATLCSVADLIGWFANIPFLTDWINSGIPMFANTAAAALYLGISLLLLTLLNCERCRQCAGVLGFFVAMIGSFTLFQHVSGINLGIDTILVKPVLTKAAVAPGRMGPPACISYTLLGLAAFFIASRRPTLRRVVPGLGLAVVLITAVPLMGYISGADPLFAAARLTAIAFQTAVILFILGLAVIVSVPEFEPMRTLQSRGSAGLLVRRSLPFIIAIPIILGLIRDYGRGQNWFDRAMGTSLLSLLLLFVFSLLLWWWASAVDEHDKALKKAREELEEKVKERTRELSLANEELMRSNRELEAFAYIASHDLQEPLRMVTNYVQLLERSIQDNQPVDSQDYIKTVVSAARRMRYLINDLLNYSRIRAKPLEFSSHNLETILNSSLKNLESALKESGAKLTHDPLPSLNVDEGQVVQVFQNLIGNSIKFRSHNSPLHIHVSAREENKHWVLSVKDNGIGIEPEYHEKIFQLFQRLHSRDRYEGTGIGLAICKLIVERHHGKIWVQSEQGKGATFFFTLNS